MSDSLRPHGLQPTRLLSPWNFPGKSTGVGCHFPLQWEVAIPFSRESFPTQGLNPGLPHCRQTLYRLSHQGSHNLKFYYKNMRLSFRDLDGKNLLALNLSTIILHLYFQSFPCVAMILIHTYLLRFSVVNN